MPSFPSRILHTTMNPMQAQSVRLIDIGSVTASYIVKDRVLCSLASELASEST